MKLQTKIPLLPADNPIDYDSQLLLVGSCFSNNMGEKLDYFKFRNVQNPLGILFHPKAIENLMLRALDQKHFEEEALFYHNERWHCFDAHSDLSQVSKVQLLQDLNHALGLTNRQIRVATHILLTLGTA